MAEETPISIPLKVARRKDIGPTAKLVYGAIISGFRRGFPDLAKVLGISEDEAKRADLELRIAQIDLN